MSNPDPVEQPSSWTPVRITEEDRSGAVYGEETTDPAVGNLSVAAFELGTTLLTTFRDNLDDPRDTALLELHIDREGDIYGSVRRYDTPSGTWLREELDVPSITYESTLVSLVGIEGVTATSTLRIEDSKMDRSTDELEESTVVKRIQQLDQRISGATARRVRVPEGPRPPGTLVQSQEPEGFVRLRPLGYGNGPTFRLGTSTVGSSADLTLTALPPMTDTFVEVHDAAEDSAGTIHIRTNPDGQKIQMHVRRGAHTFVMNLGGDDLPPDAKISDILQRDDRLESLRIARTEIQPDPDQGLYARLFMEGQRTSLPPSNLLKLVHKDRQDVIAEFARIPEETSAEIVAQKIVELLHIDREGKSGIETIVEHFSTGNLAADTMEIRDAMRGIRIDLDSEQQLQCEILFRDLERLTAEDADLESLGYRIGAALGRNGWYLRDSPRSEYVPGPDHPGVRQQLLIDAQLPVVPSSVPPRPELPDQQMGLPHERKSPFDPIAGGRIRHSLPATDPESPTSTVFIVDSAALDAALSADSNSAQPIQALNGVRMPSATITNPWLVNSGYDGAFITFSKPSGQKQLFLLRRSEGAGARLGTMVGNEDAAKLQEKPNIFSRWPDGFRIDKEMGALGTPTDIVFFQSTDYQMLDPDALAQAVAQELIIGVPQEMKYAAIDRGYDGPAGRDPLRLD